MNKKRLTDEKVERLWVTMTSPASSEVCSY